MNVTYRRLKEYISEYNTAFFTNLGVEYLKFDSVAFFDLEKYEELNVGSIRYN